MTVVVMPVSRRAYTSRARCSAPEVVGVPDLVAARTFRLVHRRVRSLDKTLEQGRRLRAGGSESAAGHPETRRHVPRRGGDAHANSLSGFVCLAER